MMAAAALPVLMGNLFDKRLCHLPAECDGTQLEARGLVHRLFEKLLDGKHRLHSFWKMEGGLDPPSMVPGLLRGLATEV